jgi:3-hydroxy acid dehydrogenase/malonic semialdehyde reductase
MVRGREHIGGESAIATVVVLADGADIADDDIQIMINTNVVGLIRLTQLFVKEMKKQDSGVCCPYPPGQSSS